MNKTVLVLSLSVLLGCSRAPSVSLPVTDPWKDYHPAQETYNGVPIEILDRLIQSESSWRVTAQNKTRWEHSVGLAQVNTQWLPYFREKYGLEDPMKPSQALDFASRYLYDLYLATGSWYQAVLAYKCGLGRIEKAPLHIRRIAWWVAEGKE